MATHSSILAWRIPWTEEPCGLQPMGLQRDRNTDERLTLHPINNVVIVSDEQRKDSSIHIKRREVKSLSLVRLFVTPGTVAYQAPPSMEFSRHEYWSGLPFPSPEDLPDPVNKPGSPALQADALLSELLGKPCIQTPLPSRLPHNIEQSSLCYIVDPCWLFILNIAVCTCPPQAP